LFVPLIFPFALLNIITSPSTGLILQHRQPENAPCHRSYVSIIICTTDDLSTPW
jgi:hypothetical protein